MEFAWVSFRGRSRLAVPNCLWVTEPLRCRGCLIASPAA
jgi:hypothetical protein